MFTLGPLAFASPWILAALVGLPVIWWLLRVMPPAPQRIRFPAIRFLLDLQKHEETPAHTPWWLLLLRLLISALIILALADPILNPTTELEESDVVVLVIDDNWAAAPNWPRRRIAMNNLLDQAERENKPIAILTTAPSVDSQNQDPAFTLLSPSDARGAVKVLQPKPFIADRRAALGQIDALEEGLQEQGFSARIIWLSDGIDYGAASEFGDRLAALGELFILSDPPERQAWALTPPENTATGLTARVVRPTSPDIAQGKVRVLGNNNRLLGYADFEFGTGEQETFVDIELPLELRNQAQRLEIEGRASAGAVALLDERWKRRLIGLVVAGNVEKAQPLLSDVYYLEKAISPFAEVRQGSIQELLDQNVSVLLLADVGQIVGEQKASVDAWVGRGGLLVRFAGPRMASQSDDLVPVNLRQGGRALGGALSWSVPQGLSPFDETSPFFGLAIPDDVLVRRQVLAQPGIDLSQRTWARLSDGTPLVTAAARGKGNIVLFHVTAGPEWSTLPISGLYVEMLKRITALAAGLSPTLTSGDAGTTRSAVSLANLRPLRSLDGFGILSTPPPTAAPIMSADLETIVVEPRHPPGLYGNDQITFALNSISEEFTLTAIANWPDDAVLGEFVATPARSLKPALLAAALLLILIDGLCAAALAGRLMPPSLRADRRRLRHASAMIIATITLMTWLTAQAIAQESDDAFALQATLKTPLAYVVTGVKDVDAMSQAGLAGLSRVLSERTAMEPAAPMGVDIERDELAFFPFLYWPVVEGQPAPSARALAKVDAFMKNGGTILFDTQDHQSTIPGLPGSQMGNASLQRLLASLDIPPLEPVPQDHVLTKAFYLLQAFPGRWTGGRVWVEARSMGPGDDGTGGSNDGVSAIIIGSNDYAAAWAEDSFGRPLAAVVPGGRRQRELAFRFGVNLVMYTLTGNYKADQVHIPALLERLGQ